MKFVDDKIMSGPEPASPKSESMTLWLVKPEDKDVYGIGLFEEIKHNIEEASESSISTEMDWPEAIASAEEMAHPQITMNPNNPLFDFDDWKAFKVDIISPLAAAEKFTAVAVMVKDKESGRIVLYVVRKPEKPSSDWHEVTITMLLRHYFNIDWISPSQMIRQINASTTGTIASTLRYRVK